ncbi:MAG TPA: HNH endonuclease [Candidatus Polarisedimenticolia bacterium]|nr:HNH endonuclease [Candidatus Polarisedimenticolia bacterium]
MNPSDLDLSVRLAAMDFLKRQTAIHAEALPRAILVAGFTFQEQRVALLGPPGIFKPTILPEIPLSITTVPETAGRPRPYEDEIGPDGFLRYRYRGADPRHRDNVGLRQARESGVPLIYFYGLIPGRYAAVYPVYIVGDDPGGLTFTVAVDAAIQGSVDLVGLDNLTPEARRAYATVTARRRLHQEMFRQQVLLAYHEQCAVCRLRHGELLEAAHILPDRDPRGLPVVPNGLALCRLHHAAFDKYIMGIRPDYSIEVREDVLQEHDGPMLVHGLQGFHDRDIVVPRPDRLRPDREFLEERYLIFKKAG